VIALARKSSPAFGALLAGAIAAACSSTPAPSDSSVGPVDLCAAIASVSAAGTSPTSITLTWAGEEGAMYEVQRKTYCGSDDYIVLTMTDVPSYTDSDVIPHYVYWYLLTATDSSKASASIVLAVQATAGDGIGCTSPGMPQPSDASTTCQVMPAVAAQP
jgi:hypothetical protein